MTGCDLHACHFLYVRISITMIFYKLNFYDKKIHNKKCRKIERQVERVYKLKVQLSTRNHWSQFKLFNDPLCFIVPSKHRNPSQCSTKLFPFFSWNDDSTKFRKKKKENKQEPHRTRNKTTTTTTTIIALDKYQSSLLPRPCLGIEDSFNSLLPFHFRFSKSLFKNPLHILISFAKRDPYSLPISSVQLHY